ncbi:MAG: HupE/UreJ family protein [Polyangiaceae bacterium]|nr:HupE/UreJ family protein [Polyangiaceae bacterium]
MNLPASLLLRRAYESLAALVRQGARPALAAFALVAAFAVPRAALAHSVGLSRGEYALEGDALSAELYFARGELLALAPDVDADHDRALSEAELAAAPAALDRALASRLSAERGGVACVRQGAPAASLVEEDGALVRVAFRCAGRATSLSLDLAFIDSLGQGHRHLGSFRRAGEGPTEFVALRGHASASFGLAEGAAAHAEASGPMALFWMGVEHILTGYDHLVFLFGLVLVASRLRSILAVVSAFTLAHSITLGAAALGAWAPSPSLVEPAIALSVAYVGVENFLIKSADRRWLITFPFGLVHGFGFAGALQELALPKGETIGALVAFNLGVEAGQLAVLALVLPALVWARKSPAFARHGLRVLSAAVVVAGVGWFVERVVAV